MCIDALWRVYTVQLALSLAAVHGEWHSVIVLYRKGKVQSCEGFMKEWFDRQHTNTSLLYREGFGEGQGRHAVSKRSSYLRKVLQRILLCAFVNLAACQWRKGRSTCRMHPGRERSPTNRSNYRVAPTRWICLASYRLPQTMLLAQRGWHSAKGGELGELREGGPCQGPYPSLSYLQLLA